MIVMGAVNERREGGWEDLVTAQKSWNSVRGRVAHVLMGYTDTHTHEHAPRENDGNMDEL